MSFKRTPLKAMVLVSSVVVVISIYAQAGGGTAEGTPNAFRGATTWDKWWVIVGLDPPVGDHPLYPVDGPKAGSTTFRCKECHGWDYKGAAGAYGKGSSHFTGIPGVFGSTMTPAEMFDVIKFDNGTETNGHGFGPLGMGDQFINEVVEFMQTMLVDTDAYIDGAGQFLGDCVQGDFNYTQGGSLPCLSFHGATGTTINFHDPATPEWVGTIAVDNPWELLHKGQFGQPGAPMPSFLQEGVTTQGVADIGKYAQMNFPTGTCNGDVNLDGIVDVDDLVDVILNWGACP